MSRDVRRQPVYPAAPVVPEPLCLAGRDRDGSGAARRAGHHTAPRPQGVGVPPARRRRRAADAWLRGRSSLRRVGHGPVPPQRLGSNVVASDAPRVPPRPLLCRGSPARPRARGDRGDPRFEWDVALPGRLRPVVAAAPLRHSPPGAWERGHTKEFEGLSEAEKRALLEYLKLL